MAGTTEGVASDGEGGDPYESEEEEDGDEQLLCGTMGASYDVATVAAGAP